MSLLDLYPEKKDLVHSFTKSLMQNVDQVSSFIQNPGQFLIQKALQKFAPSVARGFTREGASIGLAAREKIGQSPETSFIPTTKFQKFVFGEEPIGRPKEEGAKFLKELGSSEQFSQKFGLPVFAGLAALDFTGLGGESKVLRQLAKITDPGAIRGILKEIGMADDLIENFVEPLVKSKTTKEVKNILSSASELAGTTRAVSKSAGLVDGAVDNIAKVSSPISKERGFISSVKEEFPAIKAAGQYVPRDTDTLAIKAQNLIKDNLELAENIARTKSDDVGVATASQLIKHYGDEAIKTTDQIVKDALNDKAADIANIVARKLTEQGRAVQAASILSRLTPEGQVRFAAKEISRYNESIDAAKGGIFGLKKKIPELTGQQVNYITTEMKAIEKMPSGMDRAVKFQKLQNYISDLVPSPLLTKLTTVWKAGLLTGLKTSGVNIFSNISHAGSEIIKDIPGVIVDKVASLFTGKRALSLNVRGKGGVKEGFEKGFQYLKTGFDERNIAQKLDYKKVNFGKGRLAKGLKKYTETVFGIIGAEDQPFYYGAKARSFVNQAIAQAKNKGLKGSEAKKFIEELVSNPSDEMVRYAVLDAETAVFQNRTALGEVARTIQKIPGAEFIVPFGRTPSAVAMQVINYSPAGIIKTIISNIGKGKFDQRLFSQGLGRGITGTGVLYVGYKLFEKGFISLDRPKTEKEQELWRIEGRKPNSIKIGDKWRTVQSLGPLGNLLLIGGHFSRAIKDSGSPSEAIGTAIAGTAKSFTEQTFLTGVNQFMDAVTDPLRSGPSLAKSFAGSSVPTFIADVAKAIDPNERRTESILEAIEGRLPVLRESLEPQVDVLGKEQKRVGNFFEMMVDPTRPSPIQSSPVISELRRLWDVGVKVSPTKLGDKEGFKALTPEQNTEVWKQAGEITNEKLQSLFNLEGYQDLTDEEKGSRIEKVVDKAKEVSRAAMAIELTQGLSGDELKQKLSELKAGGLITKSVYDLYLELR